MLQVHQLSVQYPDGHVALSGVSFEIGKGDRVGVIGSNGAGKTTCFLSLCGVIAPSAGDIRLHNRLLPARGFRPELGLIMQNPDDQLFAATVYEDVAFGPTNMGCADVAERVETALATVGMSELAERPPHHLSGGQKRMVAIATVLAMTPELLICDEPSANLDLRSRRRLIQWLQHSAPTLLVASHDLELILELCDRVLVFDGGCLVAEGKADQIMADAAFMMAHGLEVPRSLA